MSIYDNYNQQRKKGLPQRYKEDNNIIELHRNVIENINNNRKEKEIEEYIREVIEDILKEI